MPCNFRVDFWKEAVLDLMADRNHQFQVLDHRSTLPLLVMIHAFLYVPKHMLPTINEFRITILIEGDVYAAIALKDGVEEGGVCINHQYDVVSAPEHSKKKEKMLHGSQGRLARLIN